VAAEQEQAPDQAGPAPPGAAAAPWREIWQLPTLVGAVAALGLGLAITFTYRPVPDYDALLDGAARRIDTQRYQAALGVLNGKLAPLLGRDSFTPQYQRRFHVLRARALALAQADLGQRVPENDRNIVAEYRNGERSGASLGPADTFYLADAYLALDEVDLALARVDGLPADARHRRHALYRRAIERVGMASPAARERVLELVAQFIADPTVTVDDRAWAELQRARVLAASGQHGEVVDRLLRTHPRWSSASPESRGLLTAELGAAHLEVGERDDARAALSMAERLAPPQSAARGRAIVLLGRLDVLDGRPEAARDRYERVLRELGWSPAAQAARLGLAEVLAAAGEHDLAQARFGEAIDTLNASGEEGGVSRGVLVDALLTQYRQNAAAGDHAQALRYARLADAAFTGERSPDLTLALAEAHLAQADDLLRQADAAADAAADPFALDATTRDEVRRHLRSAGGFFALHADLVTLDEAAFERSTWLSAVSFDRAGDLDLALEKLTTFVTAISESPRRAEARYRLGRIYQAQGRYAAAADAFRALIDDAADAEVGKDVGPFALRAYVPLSQTLLADADPANDQEAERLLSRVLAGGLVGPESLEYRDALLEMGNLHYRAGRYAQAILRLTEAAARFQGERVEHMVRFRLADSYRLEARRIARALEEVMPGSERRELERLRAERLRTAIEHFERVRTGLESLASLSSLERDALRNTFFYLGACPFDLGEYELAVRNYAAAYARYANDPAALVPLIQIVRARLAQGELALARAANDRARRVYESFPQDVWDDSALPLTREDWQRWFEASERLATAGP